MAHTIDGTLSLLLRQLEPDAEDWEAATRLRGPVEECLRRQLALADVVEIGSRARGTGVRGYSSVDLLAAIPGHKLRIDSDVSLRRIGDVLAQALPQAEVEVRCPAVRVRRAGERGAALAVLPVEMVERSPVRGTCLMAHRSGGWMLASPEAHGAWVDAEDARLQGSLKPLIRALKAWSFLNDTGLHSFWIELRATQWAFERDRIDVASDIQHVLRHLLEYAHAMPDPLSVGPPIEVCELSRFTQVFGKVERGIMLSAAAREAAGSAHLAQAELQWRAFLAEPHLAPA